MNGIFNFYDLLQIELQAPEREFSEYFNLEFGHWQQKDQSDLKPGIPAITVRLDRKLYDRGTVWALGKGIFLNETSNEILVSRDRGTSFFDPDHLYASLTNIHIPENNRQGSEKNSQGPENDRAPEGSGKSGGKRSTVNEAEATRLAVRLHPGVLEPGGGLRTTLRELKRRYIRQDPRSLERKISEKFVSQYIEPNIYRLFLESGHLLIHAAALEKEGHGILIFGPQNVGKTTVTIGLTKNGWKMLGDDLCLIDRQAGLRAYPKPLKLERELLENSEEARKVAENESVRQDPALNSLSGSFWRRAGSYEIKVPPSSLGVRLAEKSPANTAFFLRRVFRSGESRQIGVEKLDRESAITLCEQHISAEYDVNKHLDRDIRQNLALHYGLKGSRSVITPRVSETIREAFSDIDAYMLTINDPQADVTQFIEKTLSGGNR